MVAQHHAVDKGFKHPGKRLGFLAGVELEARHALERDLREHAQGAKAHPGGLEKPGIQGGGALAGLAVRQDDPQGGDGPGESGEGKARSVGRGVDRAGQRLVVDVAHVGQGQAVGLQEAPDVAQPGSRAKADLVGERVDADDAAEVVKREQRPAGCRDRRERMRAANHLQGGTRVDCGTHGGGDFGFVPRHGDGVRGGHRA